MVSVARTGIIDDRLQGGERRGEEVRWGAGEAGAWKSAAVDRQRVAEGVDDLVEKRALGPASQEHAHVVARQGHLRNGVLEPCGMAEVAAVPVELGTVCVKREVDEGGEGVAGASGVLGGR
jgi:hypothetical protein